MINQRDAGRAIGSELPCFWIRERSGLATPGAVDRPGVEVSIGFGAEVGKQAVTAPPPPLGAERREVQWPDDDLFAGTRVGLREDAAVEVDHHAPPRPRERRVI